MTYANYDVTYTCGHTVRTTIRGPYKTHDSQIKHLEQNHICPTCYKERKRKEADEILAPMNPPELTGTPKQVAWAVDIRRRFLEEYYIKLPLLRDKYGLKPYIEKLGGESADTKEQIRQEVIRYIVQHKTEAKWWIDNGYGPTNDWLRLSVDWVTSVIGKEARIEAERAYVLSLLQSAQKEQEDAIKQIQRPRSGGNGIAPAEGWSDEQVQAVVDKVRANYPNQPNYIDQPTYGEGLKNALQSTTYKMVKWERELNKIGK